MTERKTKRDGWYVYTYVDHALKSATIVRVTLFKDDVEYMNEQVVGDKNYEHSEEPHRDAIKRGQMGVFRQIQGIGRCNTPPAGGG